MEYYRPKPQNVRRKDTLEYIWEKWWKKLWVAYPKCAHKGNGRPPREFRNEFIADMKKIVELQIKEIAPEICNLTDVKEKEFSTTVIDPREETLSFLEGDDV